MIWQTILKRETTSFSGMARLTDVLDDHNEITQKLDSFIEPLNAIGEEFPDENSKQFTILRKLLDDILKLKETIQQMNNSYQEEQGMAWGMLQEDYE